MVIRKATIDDINLLIQLRIDYLLEENKLQSLQDIESVRGKLYAYFNKWIPGNECLVFLAEGDCGICATAFLSIVERPPRSAAASYLVGTVYNVFTYPQYRRKGIATKVMQALLEEAQALGVASVDLLATGAGKPLYEKLGFQVSTIPPWGLSLKHRCNRIFDRLRPGCAALHIPAFCSFTSCFT